MDFSSLPKLHLVVAISVLILFVIHWVFGLVTCYLSSILKIWNYFLSSPSGMPIMSTSRSYMYDAFSFWIYYYSIVWCLFRDLRLSFLKLIFSLCASICTISIDLTLIYYCFSSAVSKKSSIISIQKNTSFQIFYLSILNIYVFIYSEILFLSFLEFPNLFFRVQNPVHSAC